MKSIKKKNALAVAVCAMLIVVFLLAQISYAEVNASQRGRTIRVGYIEGDEVITQQEDGSYTGYGVEYLEKIADETGWTYEYKGGDLESQLERLRRGELDLLCHVPESVGKESGYLISKHKMCLDTVALYVKQDDDRYYYNDFEHFDGMRLAVIKGLSMDEDLELYAGKKKFGYSIVTYTDLEHCFAALDKGEVDGVVCKSNLICGEAYRAVCKIGTESHYLVMSERNAGLMEMLDDAARQIEDVSPTFLESLAEKYYGTDEEKFGLRLTRTEAELIERNRTYTVAFIPNRYPYSKEDENGNIVGIVPDLMRMIERESGLKFEYVMMEQGERALDYLADHPDDLLAGVMYDNPAFSSSSIIKSDYMLSDEVVLVCRMGTKLATGNGERAYKLAIPKAYAALESHILEYYPQYELVQMESTKECLDALVAGKVDFVAQNANIVMPYLNKPQYDRITILPTAVMLERNCIIGNNQEENQILMQIMNKCIAGISETEKSQIVVDHTVTNAYKLTWKDMLYRFRYPALAIAVLLGALTITLLAYSINKKRSYISMGMKNIQLTEALDQAAKANQAKSVFLARMSHEMRTPVNAIVGIAELAKDRLDEPEVIEDYLKKIDASSRLLLGIINDVLDMSAIESNKMKLSSEPFDLEELLVEITDVYYSQCRQKKIDFKLNVAQLKHTRLIGDSLRLNQILVNLISNAYKFTPPGGKIRVTAKEVSRKDNVEYVQMIVSDTGEGMSEEMQKRLFKPFEQEDAETAQRHGGSGLGLSITKNLVEMMKGSISVESKKNEGTTITVSIPFEMQGADGQESANTDAREMETDMSLMRQKKGAEAYNFEGRRVLLAEDNSLNAEIATKLLQKVNIETEHVENGKMAVERFENSVPGAYDLILMDIQMPEMNGYEAARAIRASYHEDAKKIPIFAMTANAFDEDVSKALNAGMNGHIAKPINVGVLYETLWNAMGIEQ